MHTPAPCDLEQTPQGHDEGPGESLLPRDLAVNLKLHTADATEPGTNVMAHIGCRRLVKPPMPVACSEFASLTRWDPSQVLFFCVYVLETVFISDNYK